MSEPSSSNEDDQDGETIGEPPSKQMKLDIHPVIENSACAVNIYDLPDEVIVTILSFFTFTELIEVAQNVCTQWRRASHDPLLWHNRKYCVGEDKSDAELLTTLSRMPQLRSLAANRPVKAAVLHAVCDNCTRLRSVELASSQQIRYSLLNNLVMNCKNLQSLTIPDRLLVDEHKSHVLAKLERLRSLKVMKTYVDEKCIHLVPLANGCPQLSKLKVLCSVYLCTKDLNQFIEGKCKSLTHLSLPWKGKNERCVVPLLTVCISLVELILHCVPATTRKLMKNVRALSHISSLRSLSLNFDCNGPPPNPLAFKFCNLSQLQVLKISTINLRGGVLMAICEACPLVKELQLRHCRGLDDGNLKDLRRLRKLETLSLVWCGILYGEALLHVAQLPNLRKLLLENYDLMELKDGLPFLLQIRSLEILSFAFSQNACCFQFERIPETLTNLRVLNVKGCVLDKSMLEQMKNQMPCLKIYAPYPADRKSSSELERLMRL